MVGESDAFGVFNGSLPSCINGIVSFMKEGYLGSAQPYSATEEGGRFSAAIHPLVTREARAEAVLADGRREALTDQERAVVSLVRKGAPGDMPYATAVELRREGGRVTLAPGARSPATSSEPPLIAGLQPAGRPSSGRKAPVETSRQRAETASNQ